MMRTLLQFFDLEQTTGACCCRANLISQMAYDVLPNKGRLKFRAKVQPYLA